jgi:Raf kinase inhibitor-like YbhB/YbcL family protein
MQITSKDIQPGQPIPTKFTCDGQSYSPHLAWSDVPEGTEAFALVLHDPHRSHAKGFVHWLVYNISAETREVASSIDSDTSTLGTPGVNGTHQPGYIGPCPPTETHNYNFHLYALKQQLDLKPNASYDDLQNAMAGLLLEQATLTGTYQRA